MYGFDDAGQPQWSPVFWVSEFIPPTQCVVTVAFWFPFSQFQSSVFPLSLYPLFPSLAFSLSLSLSLSLLFSLFTPRQKAWAKRIDDSAQCWHVSQLETPSWIHSKLCPHSFPSYPKPLPPNSPVPAFLSDSFKRTDQKN